MASGSSETEPDFLSDDAPALPRPKRNLRTIIAACLVVVVTVALAVAVPYLLIRAKQAELHETLARQLEILATGRAEVIEAWLDGTTELAARIVDSELFRLFAAEVDHADGNLSRLTAADGARPAKNGQPRPDWSLSAQLPFMEQVLSDFIANTSLISGHLIGRDGAAYVTSAGAAQLTADQEATAAAAIEAGAVLYGPVEMVPTGLVMDVFMPVFPPQSEDEPPRAVAALLLRMPVGNKLAEVVAPRPLSDPSEQIRLVQHTQDGYAVILPGGTPPLLPVEAAGLLEAGPRARLRPRPALLGPDEVFAVAAPVPGPAWWVVQEMSAAAAKAGFWRFAATAIVVAVLVVAAVLSAFGAFWWRLANRHNRAMAEQFKLFAARLHTQKRFLDGINASVAEQIGLKAADGTYTFVNPAFAAALGREADKVVGLDDAALFGQGTADRLRVSDRAVLESGQPVTCTEEVYVDSRLRHLQISKVPFNGEDGKPGGILSVTRDVTASVEQQRKREQAIQQMVAALVRAVELRDPYLSGHSTRVAGFAVEVAQRLGLEAEAVATVEIAAKLSQIGKLGVPLALLRKTERLDEAEQAKIRRHVDHAATLLRDLDFELPVLETIYQMHERLDGGGYPKGLAGEEIRLSARILAACDVFCARIEPRAYRAGIGPEAALDVLRQNPARYDAQVVEALGEVVRSIPGEKLVADLARG